MGEKKIVERHDEKGRLSPLRTALESDIEKSVGKKNAGPQKTLEKMKEEVRKQQLATSAISNSFVKMLPNILLNQFCESQQLKLHFSKISENLSNF